MKTTHSCLMTIMFLINVLTVISQNEENYNVFADVDVTYIPTENSSSHGDNGFKFETFATGINTEYADYGVGFFKEKFISFSARKIGLLAKKDPNTGEPFTKLFCSDITYEHDLKRPQFFSSILNRNDNLASLAFTNNGNTIYFTKSKENDSQSFDIYRADMNPNRDGEWVGIIKMSINGDYSIENPHVSEDGKWLYFSSNKPEAIGGFDIFRVAIHDNILRGKVQRIEGSVNTVLDEKFPQTSLDGKYLFFSSQGHNSQGGFDIYKSKLSKLGFVSVRNLGNSINSPADDVAYIQATPTIGYITSNREGGKGGYDIYKVKETLLTLSVSGHTLDIETNNPLENATVVLLDEYGEEVASTRTGKDGYFKFPVDGHLNYTLISYKEGFTQSKASINTTSSVSKNFEKNLLHSLAPAEIIVIDDNKTIIKIDAILFDNDSAKIKEVSTHTLKKVIATLNSNPQIKIEINAHTDSQGNSKYNKSLSNERAISTMNYLLSNGISSDRMNAKGYGEEQLLINCENCTDEQNELNRRVEFVVITD